MSVEELVARSLQALHLVHCAGQAHPPPEVFEAMADDLMCMYNISLKDQPFSSSSKGSQGPYDQAKGET